MTRGFNEKVISSKDGDFLILASTEGKIVLFSVLNNHYLYDVHSMNLFLIDEISMGLASSEKFWQKNDLKPIFNESSSRDITDRTAFLIKLRNSNLIFSNDNKAKETQSVYQSITLSSLCLILTYNCNLKCSYCYQHDIKNYMPKQYLKPSIMSEDIGQKAIDMLLNNTTQNNFEITFFGGEPFLCFDLIMHLTEYAKTRCKNERKTISFSVTTNGTLLTPKVIDFCADNDFSIIVSFDGTKEIQNSQRRYKNDNSSYNDIIRNLEYLSKSSASKNVTIRGTYTRESIKDLVTTVDSLNSLGFSSVSVEPSYLDIKNPLSLKTGDINLLKKSYNTLLPFILSQIKNKRLIDLFHLRHFISVITNQVPQVNECAAGIGVVSVTADGCIYPCDATAGIKDLSIGNIETGISSILQEKWRKCVNDKDECKKCWAKYFCGGGCRAWAFLYNYQDIDKPYSFNCAFIKNIFPYAMWLKTELLRLGYDSKYNDNKDNSC